MAEEIDIKRSQIRELTSLPISLHSNLANLIFSIDLIHLKLLLDSENLKNFQYMKEFSIWNFFTFVSIQKYPPRLTPTKLFLITQANVYQIRKKPFFPKASIFRSLLRNWTTVNSYFNSSYYILNSNTNRSHSFLNTTRTLLREIKGHSIGSFTIVFRRI